MRRPAKELFETSFGCGCLQSPSFSVDTEPGAVVAAYSMSTASLHGGEFEEEDDDDDNKDNEDEGDRDAEKVEVEDDEGGGDERINLFIDLPSKARPWFSPLVPARSSKVGATSTRDVMAET